MAKQNAIRLIKPTTSARRKMSYLLRSEITESKPLKSLTVKLNKRAGRDESGKISVRHRGGGAKRKYRLVDFSLLKYTGIPATVETIEYDPNRSGYIARVKLASGKRLYTLAPKGLKVGMTITQSPDAELTTGNRLPIEKIPTGVAICNIELYPGQGGKIVRSAGTSAVIVAKEGMYAQVRLPSGEVRLVHIKCLATIGAMSNEAHASVRLAKAGRVRHLGRRPQVRGKAMNPKDHPHGGGEGVSPIGLKHPKTPTGKPALGYKTRRNKRTDRFIVVHRKKSR